MKMKLTLFVLLFLFGSFMVHAQVRKIPSEVTEAFKTRYPHGEKVSWKDDITSFEAQFILNGYEMTAYFTSKGDWLKSEKKIKFEELPAAVQNGFSKSKYTDWEKSSVSEVDKDEENIQYRIMVKKSAVQKKYLYFDTNGKLIKESLTL